MEFSVIFYLIFGIVALAKYYLLRKYNYWKSRDVPYVKPNILFGNARGVGVSINPASAFQSFYEELKGKGIFGGVYLFTEPVVVATDLDFIRQILVKDFQCFPDRGFYSNSAADPLTAHLLAIEGDHWRNMRNKLTPTFTSGKMKMMHWTLLQVADQLKEYLIPYAEKGIEIDFKEVLAKFSTDVIGSAAFGIDVNSFSDPENDFRKHVRIMDTGVKFEILKMFFANAYRNFAKKIGLKIFNSEITHFFMDLVTKTVDYRDRNNVHRNDFLSLLLRIRNTGSIDGEKLNLGTLTVEEIAAQTFFFFVAGFETSSSTMALALYELALNPDIQDKARKEVQDVLEKNKGRLNYEAAMSLKYLEQVIKETLRKYPVMPNILRRAKQDYKVPNTNHTIEEDIQVVVPVLGIHRDPDIYHDPDKFDPDRFTPENIAARHPFAWIPFGEGPRNCIGMPFGLMQTRIGLAQILSNFKISPTENTHMPPTFIPSGWILIPQGGMHLKIETL